MEKNDFIKHYQLSDAVPMDPTLRTIPAEALAYALKEFTYDRFRGIARVNSDNVSSEAVLLSADYVAYFFKMLLTYIYGRVFIEINVSSDTHYLTFLITSEEELPLTKAELRSLIKISRNAGMEFYLQGKEIKLKLAFSRAASHRVYAISVGDGRRTLLNKLHELFFCGSECTKTKVDIKKDK